MSSATQHWTAESPQRWAESLGLVGIPLFGPERASDEVGQHTLLLDGERGSFILSVCNIDSPDDFDPLHSWCWSSNVTFGAVVRPRTRFVTLLRWDARDSLRRFTVEDERSVRVLFDKLASTTRPKAPSAVQRLITVFRSLRRALLPTLAPEQIIKVFNSFLIGADAVRRGALTKHEWLGCDSLDELLAMIAGKNVIEPVEGGAKLVSPPSFLIHEFAGTFLERDPITGCKLDANLLMRHASGLLYQEAHLELERPIQIQGRLFGIPSGELEKGNAKPDARFTAPPLARLLAEQALIAHVELSKKQPGDQVIVLDPACGSGVFLVESWRELSARDKNIKARLIGYDQSAIACEMAEFCVKNTINPESADVHIEERDSLDSNEWDVADVILMNPPFTFWNDMSESERKSVESILGELCHDHADKALAFIHRAVLSLRPGAVLACVVPAPLLESNAGYPWREYISNEPSLSVRLIGCFRGFNYFRGAIVEPAFLVIARVAEPEPTAHELVQVILAKDGFEDQAIRQLRRDPSGMEGDSPDWSVFKAEANEFSPASWLPRSRESSKRMRTLSVKGHPRVNDLFRVMLGIRTGHNKALVIKRQELKRLGLPPSEMQWFRPAASNATIRSGRLLDTLCVFYPYTESGACVFETDAKLQAGVPNYYQHVLAAFEGELKARKSLRDRHWWEPVEPRTTWQTKRYPKIVSTYFGQRGSFAFDDKGRFAVTQGFGWIWRKSDANAFASSSLPWAYLTILNSRVFQGLLAHYCPTVRGGQYDLSVRFVGDVPLPDLGDATRVTGQTVTELAEYGRTISTGEFPSLDALDRAVCRIYGLPFEDWVIGEA